MYNTKVPMHSKFLFIQASFLTISIHQCLLSLEWQLLQQGMFLKFYHLFSKQFVRDCHFLPPSNTCSVMHACTVIPILTTLLLNWHNSCMHHYNSVMLHDSLNSRITVTHSKQRILLQIISQGYIRTGIIGNSKCTNIFRHFISDRLFQGNLEEYASITSY